MTKRKVTKFPVVLKSFLHQNFILQLYHIQPKEGARMKPAPLFPE